MPSLLNQISIVNGKLVQFDDMLVKYASSSSVTPTPTPEPTPVPPPEPPEPPFDPLNPLGLPPFTIRCKFDAGYTPTMGTSQTLVDEDENVWDITKNSNNWDGLFQGCYFIFEVLGANTTSVTSMNEMFNGCVRFASIALFDTSSVTSMNLMFNATTISELPLFDTSSVTSMNRMLCSCRYLTKLPLLNTHSAMDMKGMCMGCEGLTQIPLFDTTSATDVSSMFSGCMYVESGALALYQQASSQANPPAKHASAFDSCGVRTTSGMAEFNQIPKDWGGNKS